VRLTGVQGATNTTVQRSGAVAYRIITMTDAGAAVEGLTIRNGSGQDGAGISMTGGIVRDCIVRDNSAGSWGQSGGGIYMTGGAVSNCTVLGNYAAGGAGAGLYATGGRIHGCTVVSNTLFSNLYGAGVYASGSGLLVSHCAIAFNAGTRDESAGGAYVGGGACLRNCLVRANRLQDVANNGKFGGGVYLAGAGSLVESCTIVTNTVPHPTGEGGGVYIAAGAVSNSIVYFNAAASNPNYRTGGSGLAFTCATPLPAGAGNIVDDPQFVSVAGGNFRLPEFSPCIGKGLIQSWMTGAFDLGGNARVLTGSVEMGAYETFIPPRGVMVTVR
jgi:hypothetical protein